MDGVGGRVLAFSSRQKLLGGGEGRAYHLTVPTMSASPGPRDDGETSIELLARVRTGDHAALERLLRRHVPALRRWASGRLPRWARDIAETEDLVQDAVIRSVRRLDTFEVRHDGALQAYLRQAVLNRIRDECRRVGNRPRVHALDDGVPDSGLSPLESAIGREGVARYEAALQQLRDEDRQAVIGRVELGYSYQELAVILQKPSPDAARVAVSRALVKLAEVLRRGR